MSGAEIVRLVHHCPEMVPRLVQLPLHAPESSNFVPSLRGRDAQFASYATHSASRQRAPPDGDLTDIDAGETRGAHTDALAKHCRREIPLHPYLRARRVCPCFVI
jgi:hypothetical protein